MKKRKSILIVDDNVGFVKLVEDLLSESSRIDSIDTAYSSEEATDLLSKDPDLVLLDISLPGANGLSLLKKIKTTKKNCEVIMVTNHSDAYYRQQCRELGASAFLDKTHEFERLPEIVEGYLE
jgi:DNA-binding NarL/FixJ family response regulator